MTENQRATLVDSLICLGQKFKLRDETLFLSVNLMDRFLSIKAIEDSNELTLVATASLYIACKYEEIYPPNGRELLHSMSAAEGFSYDDLLKQEHQIIFKLEFQISETTPYTFLCRYVQVANATLTVFHLAQYLLELALLDSKMNQYPPSLQAASALYVAMRVFVIENLKNPGCLKIENQKVGTR